MKLAEALITRAGYNQRYHELKRRLLDNVMVQEGLESAEEPAGLLAELRELLEARRDIICRINRTNVATRLPDGSTIADAIAKRDQLSVLRELHKETADAGIARQDRYSRKEIRCITTINVAEYQKTVDRLSREHRELDTIIQGLNWTTDLVA